MEKKQNMDHQPIMKNSMNRKMPVKSSEMFSQCNEPQQARRARLLYKFASHLIRPTIHTQQRQILFLLRQIYLRHNPDLMIGTHTQEPYRLCSFWNVFFSLFSLVFLPHHPQTASAKFLPSTPRFPFDSSPKTFSDPYLRIHQATD